MNERKPNKPFKNRKKDILRLRKKGLSYRAIAKKLGCSTSIISYHCGKNQKEKFRVRLQGRSWKHKLTKKITSFKSRCTAEEYRTFRNKVKTFKRKIPRGGRPTPTSSRVNNISKQFHAKDVINKVGKDPVCYLTGRKLNIKDTSSYTFDHRVPTVKGGTNDLENLEICSTEANHAKAGLLLEDFYSLCEEILAWRDKQANKDGQKGRRSSKR